MRRPTSDLGDSSPASTCTNESGRIKAVAWMRKGELRGPELVDLAFAFAAAAHKLVRSPILLEAKPCLLLKLSFIPL